ncbi:YicC/YloC family endoribonuclease [Aurantivibrio infirmus]
MTGFARQEATETWGTISWELRSVNHRYLEPHFKLPELLRPLETELRNALRKKIQRGKIEIVANINLDADEKISTNIDENLVEQLSICIKQINSKLYDAAPVSAVDILRWPGVLSGQKVDSAQLQQVALPLFEEALNQLIEHRAREGKELSSLIEQRLAAIEVEVAATKKNLPAIMDAQRNKLIARIEAVKEELNQDRLEQELVFYAQKADVDEEIDRLLTHVTEVRHTLQRSGPIGRRLDFLMQELNREANTLSSKSIATDTTQSAVELKILVEQMREQIQNIE